MKFFQDNKKTILIELFICICLILLSSIGFFFSNWELIVCTSIASFFGMIYLIVFIKGSYYIKLDTSSKGVGMFYLFYFIRTLVALLGLLIPALIIYLSDKDGSKYRYLNLIAATLPFLCVNLSLIFSKERETK